MRAFFCSACLWKGGISSIPERSEKRFLNPLRAFSEEKGRDFCAPILFFLFSEKVFFAPISVSL